MNQIFLPVNKQKNTPSYLFTFATHMSQSVRAQIHILLKYVALTLNLRCMLQTLAGIHGPCWALRNSHSEKTWTIAW